MADSSRIKMSDFPLCEDTDIIESLLGVGSDKGTYKVSTDVFKQSEEEVDTSSAWVKITDYETSVDGEYVCIDFGSEGFSQIEKCLEIGGYLHLTLSHDQVSFLTIPIGDAVCVVGLNSNAYCYTSSIKTNLYIHNIPATFMCELDKTTATIYFCCAYVSNGEPVEGIAETISINSILFEPVPDINRSFSVSITDNGYANDTYISNTADKVAAGSVYYNEITQYGLNAWNVKMGGVDITSEVVTNNYPSIYIEIPKVTGDIEIYYECGPA